MYVCKWFEARAWSTFQDLVGNLWQKQKYPQNVFFSLVDNPSPYHNSEMKILLQESGISAFPFYVGGMLERTRKFTYQSMVSFTKKKNYVPV